MSKEPDLGKYVSDEDAPGRAGEARALAKQRRIDAVNSPGFCDGVKAAVRYCLREVAVACGHGWGSCFILRGRILDRGFCGKPLDRLPSEQGEMVRQVVMDLQSRGFDVVRARLGTGFHVTWLQDDTAEKQQLAAYDGWEGGTDA